MKDGGGRKRNLIMILRLFAISLAIGVPSACSSSLVEKDDGMKPGGDRFYFSLYTEYIALAKAITIGGGRAVWSVWWRAADCQQEPRLL